MHFSLSRPRAAAAATAVVALAAGLTATQAAPAGLLSHLKPQVGAAGDESTGVNTALAERAQARTAPTGAVAPGAYEQAAAALAALPTTTLGAHTVTTGVPYDADDPNYRDPAASNSGGGAGFVTGRIQGLAIDGSTIFAGGAAGGVWRSDDLGGTWTPISDEGNALPAQSIGVLKTNGDDLWVATGDGTTGSGTYAGNGVWVAQNATGNTISWQQVGGNVLDGTIIRSLVFDRGRAFAATSTGLYSHSTSVDSTPWQPVLQPCHGVGATADCSDVNSNYRDIANDVVVDPSNAQHLLANVAWRSGAAYNGFYESRNGGTTWAKINPTGSLSPKDVGNTTFGYAADGSKLYAAVESPQALNSGQSSALGGVYVSKNGSLVGPWTLATNAKQLSTTGSAEKQTAMGKGYEPGVQAWYNQFLGVDPTNPNHVYLGLEEVYESRDGGNTWTTIGRYWNFGLPCYNSGSCDGNVMHSDQHTIAFGQSGTSTAGRIFVGNDGGLYSRSITGKPATWTSLSKTGALDTLQYYSVAVGKDTTSGGVDVWGGLQDNGVSLLRGANAKTLVSPFGGDGGDQLTDPNDGCKTVGEYVYLYLQMTTNCGQTDGSTKAVKVIAPDDPNPRFTAPFGADRTTGNWVAGGQYVWTNDKTWSSTSGSDWTKVGDTGGSITAIDSRAGTIWAGWCGACNPGSSFGNGLVDTIGGFHQVPLTADVPRRMITSVEADPADPNAAYVVFGGFSRSWVTGAGGYSAGQGHVYRVTDDGKGNVSWTNISTGMPDVPADSIQVYGKTLLVGTDLGLLERDATGNWLRVSDVPMTVISKIVDGPDGNTYVATFGRGLYAAKTPGT